MADFDAVPSPDTSRAPGVRAFGSPDAPASSFDVSREALAAKAFPLAPCVDLAIGVAASLELRMDLMDVLRDLSLAERTECDATVMSVGEVSGPSAYARVADDVVRPGAQAADARRRRARARGAGGALVGTARVAAAARAVQDTLVLEPAWARFVDAEDAFSVRGRCDGVVLEALAGAAPRDVRVAAAKAARKVVVAPRGAILDAARGAHAASVSWLKSHERRGAAAYSEDEDEDVGFATPRASAPGSPVLTPLLASPGAYLAEALGALRTPGREAASPRSSSALLEERSTPASSSGPRRESICVLDKPAFCKILPRYFKLSYKTGAAAADLKKMWDSFVRQLNYYGFHKRTRGADEYAITDDPKITSPRKFSRLCRRLPISRAKDRPSISDLDRAALPAPQRRPPRGGEAIVNLFDGGRDYDLPGCDDDDADDEAPPSRLPPKKRKRRG
ncbi:H/ACA snoRNPs complex protein [Aureococcus anophagefferens]|uniref:H/ACA snoRNPs complex protein n=1 Tax=Aureococcus anophagefferens TaxID=44056 RepID=A0ABR1G4K0_AURAN